MEYIDFIVSSLNLPTFFVFGNHHLKEFPAFHNPIDSSNHNSYPVYGGATYTGFKTLTIPTTLPDKPLLIAGASGSMKYSNGLAQYTDREMKFKLLKLIPRLLWNKLRYGRYLDIFLAHSPPRHIQDEEDLCHQGFTCFRWFLEKFTPRYMIHGHIHLYDLQAQRITQYEKTKIINVFGHYILDFPWSSSNEPT